MDKTFPVLIGSKVLEYYGMNCEPKDIDLIVNKVWYDELSNRSSKKDGDMVWIMMGGIECKIDLMLLKEDNSTEAFIFNICNEALSNPSIKIPVDTIKINNEIDVIVAPVEFVYSLKKGHIHRILNLTLFQQQNIKIWHRQVRLYNMIRQNYDYKRLDWMIYEDGIYNNPLPIERQANETDLKYYMRKIFLMEFDAVNRQVGDTKLDLNKTEEEFFKDNVRRYIEHDELHKQVALYYRNDPIPLFIKHQKDGKTNVNCDKDSFFEAPYNEQLQLIIEEICVLFLERKWIPEIMQSQEICHKDFNKERKIIELNEIIAHYFTNLCGMGHSWVRRFCLDHYDILTNLNHYNFEKIYDLICTIFKLDDRELLSKPSVQEIIKEIESYETKKLNEWCYYTSSSQKEIFYKKFLGKSSNKIRLEVGNNTTVNRKLKMIMLCYELQNGWGSDYMNHIKINLEIKQNMNGLLKTMIDKIINGDNIICMKYKTEKDTNKVTEINFYDLDKNIGIIFDNGKWKLYLLTCRKTVEHYSSHIVIKCKMLDISEGQVENKAAEYGIESEAFYYYSRDRSCGYRNRYEETREYLSSFGGYLPYDISKFTEFLARFILDKFNDDSFDEDDFRKQLNMYEYCLNEDDSCNNSSQEDIDYDSP